MIRFLLLPFLVVLLNGCGNSIEADVEDVWLEQLSTLGTEWDKVALVFGYSGQNNYEACLIIKDELEEAWRNKLRCVPAN